MFLGGLPDSWKISIRKMCTGICLVTPAIPATKLFAMLSVILTLLSLNMYPAKETNKIGKKRLKREFHGQPQDS